MLAVLLAGTAVVYLLQVASPLRLNTDSIVFLGIAGEVANGSGFTYQNEETHYPPGYPFLLSMLDRMGAAASWAYIVMNFLFLLLGMAALYFLLRDACNLPREARLLVCTMVLLSYVVVKHATVPVSDMPFFGISMCAVALLVKCRGSARQFWPYLAAALAVSMAAITIRTAGIALLPGVMWVLAARYAAWCPAAGRAYRTATVLLLAVAATASAVAIGRTMYFREAIEAFANESSSVSYVTVVMYNSWTHLVEAGEIAVNVPLSRVPSFMQAGFPYVGALFVGACVYGMWTRRAKLGPVEIFVISYLVMLFGYVGYDARYWIPVLPLAFAFIAVAAARPWRAAWFRRVAMLYPCWILITGASALAYSTYVTYSGPRFPETYGTDELRAAYRVAFGSTAPLDRANADPVALELLHRHGYGR